MLDTDIIPQGDVAALDLYFSWRLLTMGEIETTPSQLTPYFQNIGLYNASLGINQFDTFTQYIEIVGQVQQDITVGNLRAQALNAVAQYNGAAWFGIGTPSTVIVKDITTNQQSGIEPSSPGIVGLGGAISNLGAAAKSAGDTFNNTLSNLTSLGTVLIIGALVFFGWRIYKEAS
jgi:hypothetical protein